MSEMKVLCTICARGGSKGVANKNVRPMNGKPLIAYSIEQAIASGLFYHVVVSTDSDEIAKASVDHGAEVFFKRPPELSSDTAAKLPVIRHAFLETEAYFGERFGALMDLDATSPLRSIEDIKGAWETFIEGRYDNLITAMPSRKSPYFNLVEVDVAGRVHLSKKLEKAVTRRQDAPKCYDMNASIYLWTRDSILKGESVIGENTGLYVMPDDRSIDIDSELDFEFVEFLMKKGNHGTPR